MIKHVTIVPNVLYQRSHMLRCSLAEKEELITGLGITQVVGLARAEDHDLYVLLGEHYYWHPIPDGALRQGGCDLLALADIIHARQQLIGGAVLCYCNAGRNRSSLMNALLWMRWDPTLNGATVVEMMRMVRPRALANEAFVDFLCAQ